MCYVPPGMCISMRFIQLHNKAKNPRAAARRCGAMVPSFNENGKQPRAELAGLQEPLNHTWKQMEHRTKPCCGSKTFSKKKIYQKRPKPSQFKPSKQSSAQCTPTKEIVLLWLEYLPKNCGKLGKPTNLSHCIISTFICK